MSLTRRACSGPSFLLVFCLCFMSGYGRVCVFGVLQVRNHVYMFFLGRGHALPAASACVRAPLPPSHPAHVPHLNIPPTLALLRSLPIFIYHNPPKTLSPTHLTFSLFASPLLCCTTPCHALLPSCPALVGWCRQSPHRDMYVLAPNAGIWTQIEART